MKNLQARITGTGAYVPKQILTNQDLEKMVETSDEWIYSRTGMKERRIAETNEFSSDMGLEAAKRALTSAKLAPEAVDMILFGTITPDYIFPSTASLIQHRLGATRAAAFDMQAACSGFIYALSMAKAYVESGLYKNVLVVISEKLSSIVDYTDRNTCVLFGDGAAACVVSAEGKGLFIRDVSLGCDGAQAEILLMPGGGCRKPPSIESVTAKEHFIRMDGKEVYKHAVRRMEMAAKESIEKAGIKESDISWLVPHQANIRIIESLAKRFDVPMEKVFITIHKYGNTSGSSVGLALDDLMREKSFSKTDNILLTAFGAGLSWGASVLSCEGLYE
jgi:3-oxoacyl-[acyl-carrier-protein] synthase-3